VGVKNATQAATVFNENIVKNFDHIETFQDMLNKIDK
jgi:hypothetical protein